VATRVTQRLGFRWFAYLRLVEDAPKLISSYPKSWTNRYFDLNYEQLDPVVRRARLEHDLFSWGSGGSTPAGTREQRKFFEEATTFGIESGITVPIRGGFGREPAGPCLGSAPALPERQIVPQAEALAKGTLAEKAACGRSKKIERRPTEWLNLTTLSRQLAPDI
jgi:LuxR family transcriptional regulator, activator of conjugal transfer of Ti plasmids